MNDRKLLCTGATGTAVAAVCCFTPVLAVGLAAVGLSAWLGWIDTVLWPALVLFAAMTVFALVRRRRGKAAAAGAAATPEREAEKPS